MYEFGAVQLEWDWIGLLSSILFVGLPVGVITYLAIRSGFKKKIHELEKRIEKLEQQDSTK
ncbi:hypothetical protein [Brevibacillus fortis]|uniref:hypothetical protein n=1 Tax=Brevibacillus fortis TaxID=2126352 RepID=UPI0038FD302F